MGRRLGPVGRVVAIGLLAAGWFVPTASLGVDGGAPSPAASTAGLGDYFDGLRVGAAQGRLEGRALQIGDTVPPGSRHAVEDAFKAGYAAGLNDAFTGFDGGWGLGSPYVVTLKPGSGGVTYRIDSRVPLAPNVNYYLCADGHSLCQQPRH